MKRQHLLAAAACAALFCAAGSAFGQAQPGTGQRRQRGPRVLNIGVQLYSVRDDCAKDLAGVLKAIGKMGYAGVEFAGYYGKSAEELKKMLDDAGLVCCGTHTGLDTLTGDNLAKTIAFNKTLGNRYLIVPGLPEERTKSKDAWLETAKLFNEIDAKVRPERMFVGYHSHAGDFKAVDGVAGWDVFFGNTGNRVVMQMDFGNTKSAGVDPIPYVSQYPGRQRSVHIKEFSKSNDKALIGEGDIDWKVVLPTLRDKGRNDWLVIEAESYATSPMDTIDKSLVNLKRIAKELALKTKPEAN